jgi:putative spermidine/putrescine transport system ATP-binding protein
MTSVRPAANDATRIEPRFDVELVAITKRYDQTVAVDAISLRIPPAAYCCLLGPSGCGKTSTLRMIAGHEHVTEGDILLRDRNITNLPPARRGTAMMFQSSSRCRISPTACRPSCPAANSSGSRWRAR